MPSTASHELLLNGEFVDRLYSSIGEAVSRVYLQVMTFDGDSSGLGVAQLLIDAAERGVDVRLTVDMFAFRYVSDIKYNQAEVAEEHAATHEMFDRMEAAGISVTYVSPFGPLLMFGPFRNHKKLYVIDDVGYIGGINISDHNFSWLDFNIGIRDSEMVAAVVDDFDATRRGEKRHVESPIITNGHVEATVVDLIKGATESIVIASPYALDLALAEHLEAAGAPSKLLIAPKQSNFRTFRLSDPYMRKRLMSRGIDVRSYANFFHAKFALIDGTKLLVGSSNFGLHSFRCNQEIAVLIEDPEFIAAFNKLLDRTDEFTETVSPFKYALGAFVASYIRSGTIVWERLLGRYAPTLTTR